MDLLITVSTKASAAILVPLLRACVRRDCHWQVFLTHEGVQVLQVPEVIETLQMKQGSAIACHDSWQKYGTQDDCPVTAGSQTNHSQMAARAARLLSL